MPETQSNAMIEYRRLRAPAGDGQTLLDPPWMAAETIVEQNVGLLRDAEVEIGGRRLPELSAEARQLLVRQARDYTAQYRDFGDLSALSDRVLLAGHQPQLFHPGVLFKNFALSALGQRLQATAINLVIDNDAAGAPSLRVPTGSPREPRMESLAFDAPAPRAPYEERRIADGEIFRSFGDRVREAIRPFVARPIIEQLWPYAVEALELTDRLGACLAQARHRLEGDWGLRSLELPLSQICQTAPFGRFVAALLADLPRFCEIHNAAVHEYRRVHGLRSRTHPVPDLAVDGPWREAPFWVWTQDDPTRRRLFARRAGRLEVELTDRRQWTLRLPLPEHDAGDAAVERLLQLADEGVKLRTRALTTTLYARLVLGDLFLHGIGGAKYDQLTDVLIRRFYGLAPPGFYAVTATVLLPVRRPGVSSDDVRRVDRHLRELRFHPEQHLNGAVPEAAPFVEAKRQWLAATPAGGNGKQRHWGIHQSNEALQPFVEPQRQRLQQEREELLEELRKERLLSSREFSFCLFPQDYLPDLLQRLIEQQDAR